MKKATYSLLAIGLFCLIGFVWAQQSRAASEMQPTPIQKAMLARAAWLKAMTADLKTMRYKEVANDATALAGQTGKIATNLSNPEAKELTMKVSTLATALAGAAGKKDGKTAEVKLEAIKATCGQCHAKFRDK